MSFYNELIDKYMNIDFPSMYSDIAKIGGKISWYFADANDNFISVGKGNYYIIDIDITGAFPAICRALFNKDSEFIQKMNQIDEKRGKNIYIATTLKSEQLRQLNNISKLIVLGIVYDTQNSDEKSNIDVLELKKDGCTVICNGETFQRLNNLQSINNEFTKFILHNNFQFHSKEYYKYYRTNRTSYFLDLEENFEIKGQFKDCPFELKNILKKIVSGEDIDYNNIKQIYSNRYLKILQKNNLVDLLNKYYVSNRKVIDFSGKVVKYNMNTQIDPRQYLKTYIFPAILSNKEEI